MTTGKQGYFNHRNQILSVRDDRNQLGEREVKTLLSMLRVRDSRSFLNGKALIDLGCGDQYIRKAFEERGAIYHGVDINECNLEVQTFPV